MRTTLRIDDDLLAELEARAHAEGVSLGELVSHLLRAGLDANRRASRRVRLRTIDMGPPKVDLDRALHVAADLEEAELLRNLALRK